MNKKERRDDALHVLSGAPPNRNGPIEKISWFTLLKSTTTTKTNDAISNAGYVLVPSTRQARAERCKPEVDDIQPNRKNNIVVVSESVQNGYGSASLMSL
jgi:hypothetical protein